MAHFSSVDRYDTSNGRASAVWCTSMKFTESAAGTYTGSVLLPSNAVLINVIVHGQVLWASGTSATLKIGDVADDDGIFIGVNLKATDLLAGESIDLYMAGGKQGADLTDAATPGSQMLRRMLTTARTISAIVTQVGTGAAGITWVHVIWAFQPTTDLVTVTLV